MPCKKKEGLHASSYLKNRIDIYGNKNAFSDSKLRKGYIEGEENVKDCDESDNNGSKCISGNFNSGTWFIDLPT